ncbi:MAG TPA: MFS transporter [Ktedonobacterales bacterium]
MEIGKEEKRPRPGWRAGITRVVVVLGAASLFTDISSEMIAPLRLLFLVQVLGTPLILAGLIEGLAEGATSIFKLFSGRLADTVSRRVPLVVAGVTLSNLVKPLLAVVTGWAQALGIVVLDRTGKAVRGSPRDAMIADEAPKEYRGKAFGFHRGMDTLGAAIGPLAAAWLLFLHPDDLRAVFAWTLLPGLLAILVVVLFLRPRRAQPREQRDLAAAPATGSLGTRFWLFLVVATVFALGNSADAFLFLRTEGLEESLAAVPIIYFGFNLAYAALAIPLGVLSDRWGRLPVLAAGYAAFSLVYLGWATATQGWHAWGLFLLYAVYYAATEGVARAFVGDLVPKARRGTALGWFNGLTGAAAIPANLLGGWLWIQWGPIATFGLSAWAGLVALGLLLAWWPWLSRAKPLTV